MSKVNIKNLTKKPMMFVLPHQKVCVASGRCLCNKDGSPSSLHVPAGHKTPADAGVVNAPEIVKALKRKKQVIIIEQIKENKVEAVKEPVTEVNAGYVDDERAPETKVEKTKQSGSRGKNK